MKAIAYNIKPQEKEWLVLANEKKHDITIITNSLTESTLAFASGKEVLLVFNQDEVRADLVSGLKAIGIKYIATVSFETDHIDLKATSEAGIKVANVPFKSGELLGFSFMQQVIKNLDQWASGKCVGNACCCQKDCAAVKELKR